MIKIKDPFSYSARWDSVGLDCSTCIHFSEPPKWPDKSKSISCKLHKISLEIELGKNGYKEKEWFCKDFQDNGKSYEKAIKEFEAVKENLNTGILYNCYNGDDCLGETIVQEL